MERDLLSIDDLSPRDLAQILELSAKVKAQPGDYADRLTGRSVAMIFEKQSLRTHVTFEVGIHQLGAHPVFLTQADISLGRRESVFDTAKNLERWVQGVVVRTFAHATLVELAGAMSIPVINALTDTEHPCQAVGDILSITEKLGSLKGKKLVFVGDGNNVCHSLMLLATTMGMNFIAATPRGYAPDPHLFKLSASSAIFNGGSVDLQHNAREAVKHADVVYTDVWVSMGEEDKREEKMEAFREFQVNEKLMSYAKPHALFMHCLPAHRGEEVTEGVMNSRSSIVFDQAENRLHTEKAILVQLLIRD